ncbi:hypothetical protein HYFRA_00010395 [Hymenoscyphus fraxineus]|uniref:Acyltransferase 3 domain-containing protein n=1 Tax=Hymenoscyphus fraxineus TaxID=746836 RepID=A0A9N9PKU3_9HELO|nr:hypothetical protein HYFRA_00010395 [Hymenoscyphus fraxineus]
MPQSPPKAKEKEERNLENGLLESTSSARAPAPSKSLQLVKSAIEILKPSILTRGPRKQIHATSYLDGMRGFAAFLMYLDHNQSWARIGVPEDSALILENAWGYNGQYYFACLPGIRTFFTGGHFALAVFYVISGFVLTTKPLSYIHAGEYKKLFDNVGSALFRRWLRLFLPAFVTTFLYISSWHIFGIWTYYPRHKETYWKEFRYWYRELLNHAFVFGKGGLAINTDLFSYNYHVWTVPTAFRGSIVVLTLVFAFARCTRNARILCTLPVLLYFLYIIDGWPYSCFISGMLLADFHQLSIHNNLPFPTLIAKLQPHKNKIAHVALLISMYLGGVPTYNADVENLEKSPGWHFLSLFRSKALISYQWFYLFWAATILLHAIPHISWLKRFFETRFCQYLGRNSYSLYLVHGPLMWVFADRIYALVGWERRGQLMNWYNKFPLWKGGVFGLELAFLVPQLLVVLPVTLWASEVVTKGVDRPIVTFTKWLYGNCVDQNW